MPRIRVSLSSGELEVEGDEGFIDRYKSSLDMLLDRLKSTEPTVATPRAGHAPSKGQGPAASFGEVLHQLPKSATGVDQILLAGQFVQTTSTDNAFSTTEANALLIEQGVKVSNPSQSLKNNLTAKRVFKVGTRYRVSKVGDDHLATIMKR